MGRTRYVSRPCLPKHIVHCKGTWVLLVLTYCPARVVLLLFKLQKGLFRSFYFRGFITVKTPELFYIVHTANFTRGQKGDLFE